jgi:WS/DGAT/MGAT family acyltransferase
MTAQPFSELDAAIFAAETPAQHLHVLATLVLDTTGESAGYAEFQARIAERFPLVEALRRRPQAVAFGDPVWVDDPGIHLASHLHLVVVDGGGLDALARVAADVASRPLRRDRPLWEVWLVEGFSPDRAAVIAKVHHAAVDGVSGFNALAAFFDLEPHPTESMWTGTWEPEPAPTAAEMARRSVESWLSLPVRVGRSARTLLGGAAALARRAGEDAPMPMSGPRLPWNGALTPARSVAFAEVTLDQIKTIRHAYDATVNDVVMALCAGVLRAHLADSGVPPDRALVAAVPTSERLAEHGPAGNRFSAMFYALPVHLDDPGARVAASVRSAAAAKDAYAAGGAGALAAVAGAIAPGVVAPVMRALSTLRIADRIPPLANVIVSNVRGPEFPLYVSGARVEEIFPMGPLVEGVGLGITVVSYRDRVGIGFLACPDLLPDVDALAARVPAALDELLAASVG